MKKFFIILGISAAVLAAALALILILSSHQGKPADDPDCRFPYTFTEKDNGILVTVKGVPDEGCTWKLMTDGLSVVSAGEFTSGSKKTTFLVKPVSFGIQAVTLAMLADGADGERDCRYTITIDFFSRADGSLMVQGSRHNEYDAKRRFEPTDGHPYAYGWGADGSLYVTIDRTGGQEWRSKADRSGIISSTLIQDTDEASDTAVFRLTRKGAGSVNVWFISEDGDAAIVMTVSVDEESGALTVTEHTCAAYDEEKQEQEKNKHDVEDTVGTIRLPDGASMTTCGLFSLRDEYGIIWTPARVVFTLDGIEWEYDAGLFGSVDALRAYCGLTEENAADAGVGTYQTWTGTADDLMSVVWAHEDGCVFALRAAGVTEADVLALAGRMDALNPLTAESIMKLK